MVSPCHQPMRSSPHFLTTHRTVIVIFRPLRVTKNLLVLSAILSCQTATAETKLDQMLDRGLTPDQVVDQWGLTRTRCRGLRLNASPRRRPRNSRPNGSRRPQSFNRAKAAGIAGAPLDIIGSLALRNETAELHIQMSVGAPAWLNAASRLRRAAASRRAARSDDELSHLTTGPGD